MNPYYSFMLQSVCCWLTWNHNKILIFPKPARFHCRSIALYHCTKTIVLVKSNKTGISLYFVMFLRSFLVELSYINQLNKGLFQKKDYISRVFMSAKRVATLNFAVYTDYNDNYRNWIEWIERVLLFQVTTKLHFFPLGNTKHDIRGRMKFPFIKYSGEH